MGIRRDGSRGVGGNAPVGVFAAAALAVIAIGPIGAPGPAHGAPGDLDSSFGDGGTQTTDFGGNDVASAVAVQSDDEIVVVGRTDGSFALARYNADGSLDTTFSGDGRQTTSFDGAVGAQGVAVQSNGYSARTRADGSYAIRDVTTGSYGCTASARRYHNATHTVQVAPGQTTTANFSLTQR